VVVLTGRKVGMLFPLNEEGSVVGRAMDCDVVLDDDGISRVHAVIIHENGRWLLRDLKSTNGTFVGSRTVGDTPLALRDGDRIRLGADVLLRFGTQDEIERQFLDHLYRSATRDSLTGLVNRRLFIERLDSEVAWHQRHDLPLSLLFIDIDHFKSINDRFGHLWGDIVLKNLSKLFETEFRTEDLVCRFGGEEFVVYMRHTDAENSKAIAERVREKVESSPMLLDEKKVQITVSIGVATREGRSLTSSDELLHEADMFLYVAKDRGRNRVVP